MVQFTNTEWNSTARIVRLLGANQHACIHFKGKDRFNDLIRAHGIDIPRDIERRISNVYWRHVFTRYLARPTFRLRQEIQYFLERSMNTRLFSRITNPFISMHVRYGDKYLEVDPIPIAKYFEALTHFENVSKVVFLSTETQDVINTAINAKLNVSYDWHYLNYSRLGE